VNVLASFEDPFRRVSAVLHRVATIVQLEESMTLSDILHDEFPTISVDATVGDAVAALARGDGAGAGPGAAPVVDRWGRVVGLIVVRDILRALLGRVTPEARRRLLAETSVLEVMNAWPLMMSPDADLWDAARELLSSNAHGLIVVKDGRLLGLISETDLVSAVAASHRVVEPVVEPAAAAVEPVAA
jgi:CBS domain-containing protein